MSERLIVLYHQLRTAPDGNAVKNTVAKTFAATDTLETVMSWFKTNSGYSYDVNGSIEITTDAP